MFRILFLQSSFRSEIELLEGQPWFQAYNNILAIYSICGVLIIDLGTLSHTLYVFLYLILIMLCRIMIIIIILYG